MYKGLMNIQCSKCGEVQQYFQPEWTTTHTCRACGGDTKLEELRKAYINCECGKRVWYYTNIKDSVFDIICHACGQPVAVEYNKKKNNYMTINRARKGDNKGGRRFD